MTYMPHVAATHTAEWHDLAGELDRWEEAGSMARLWWRDDDAVMPSRRLDRLLDISGGTPLALAVIPANAVDRLAASVELFPQVTVLHHGWCHANRAADYPGAAKKSEYPAERHPVEVADELDEGRRRLRAMFGPRALPVFVPPWNRFSARFVPLLVEAGLKNLSQMAPRRGEVPWGIRVLDVHVDIVDWRAGGSFIGDGPALGRFVQALRRERESRAGGAVGLLTHHLVMDTAAEDFLIRLGDALAAHPAAAWVDVRELIG
jgi:hypothetical protein